MPSIAATGHRTTRHRRSQSPNGSGSPARTANRGDRNRARTRSRTQQQHDRRRVAATQRQGAPQGGKRKPSGSRHQQAEGRAVSPVHDPGGRIDPAIPAKYPESSRSERPPPDQPPGASGCIGRQWVAVEHTESLYGRNLRRHLIRSTPKVFSSTTVIWCGAPHRLALGGAITVDAACTRSGPPRRTRPSTPQVRIGRSSSSSEICR